jgi:hypothetical protein
VLLCAALVLACASSPNTAPDLRDFPTDPAQAQFLTTDVDRYFRAFESGGRTGSSDPFQRIYLDSASTPLREFVDLRAVTAASLGQVASAYPRYFEALRIWWASASRQDSVVTRIRTNYARIKAQYPDAFFPPVTILMGRYSTGGTIGRNGIFIGVEFYGADANAPTNELNAFARNNQKSWNRDLAALVAHEHVHLLARAAGAPTGSGRTLLSRALDEGVAEFVGSLSSGAPSYVAFFSQWQQREGEFWAAFDRERSGTEFSRWLFNQQSATAEWPGDLGYFMGYRIAQAYYAQATDKTQALRDLLGNKNPEAILARSGYVGRGPAIVVP